MKNSIKLGLAALMMAVAFASCSGNKSTSTTDSVKADTTKHDTTVGQQKPPPHPDTAVNPNAADTAKKKM